MSPRPMKTFRIEVTWLAAILGILIFAQPAISAPTEDPNLRISDGIAVYLGIMPASIVRGHAASHPEATMHGGTPLSSFERHIVVALFDAKTFERITDADIEATVEGLGHLGRTTKKLERMSIADAPTFGGYFPFAGTDTFTIRLEIRTGVRAKAVLVEFTFRS